MSPLNKRQMIEDSWFFGFPWVIEMWLFRSLTFLIFGIDLLLPLIPDLKGPNRWEFPPWLKAQHRRNFSAFFLKRWLRKVTWVVHSFSIPCCFLPTCSSTKNESKGVQFCYVELYYARYSGKVCSLLVNSQTNRLRQSTFQNSRTLPSFQTPHVTF